MLNTGIRLGEAVALMYRDIDFDKGEISITKNAINPKERDDAGNSTGKRVHELSSTKTKTSKATIAISPFALDILREMKNKEQPDYDGFIVDLNASLREQKSKQREFIVCDILTVHSSMNRHRTCSWFPISSGIQTQLSQAVHMYISLMNAQLIKLRTSEFNLKNRPIIKKMGRFLYILRAKSSDFEGLDYGFWSEKMTQDMTHF